MILYYENHHHKWVKPSFRHHCTLGYSLQHDASIIFEFVEIAVRSAKGQQFNWNLFLFYRRYIPRVIAGTTHQKKKQQQQQKKWILWKTTEINTILKEFHSFVVRDKVSGLNWQNLEDFIRNNKARITKVSIVFQHCGPRKFSGEQFLSSVKLHITEINFKNSSLL